MNSLTVASAAAIAIGATALQIWRAFRWSMKPRIRLRSSRADVCGSRAGQDHMRGTTENTVSTVSSVAAQEKPAGTGRLHPGRKGSSRYPWPYRCSRRR
jgi:hypothetical protein